MPLNHSPGHPNPEPGDPSEAAVSKTQPSKTTRKPIFYGWVIVGVLALAGLVQTGQFNPSISVFIKPITEEFGWSRSAFLGAHAIGTIMGGLSAIGAGPALDRFGPRWIVAVGFLLIGLSLTGLAFINGLWQFYLLMILGRMAVQGGVALGLQVTAAKWFIRKRGKAMGIANLGTRLGNGLTPLTAQTLTTMSGWRTSIFVLGASTWILAMVPSALLLRRKPEDMGLRPDGDPPEGEGNAAPQSAKESERAAVDRNSFTLREALRTRAFYLLLLVTSLSTFVNTGVNLHLLPYFTDQGIPATTAIWISALSALFGAAGNLWGGYLGDRFPARYLLMVSLTVAAGAVVLLMFSTSMALGIVFGVVNGLVFGIQLMLLQLIYPDYYGRTHLGAIRGMSTPIMLVANAMGPLAAAMVFDATRSYHFIFVVYAACYMMAVGALFFSTPPRKRSPTQA